MDQNINKYGGGEKPITENQIKYIRGLCQGRNEDPESFVQNKYSKSLSELVGHEANELIKALKAPFFRPGALL